MKTVYYTTLVLVFLCIGCKKDKREPALKVYPEEHPMRTYQTKAALTITKSISTSPSQKGMEFIPKVKGKVKAFTVHYPGSSIRAFYLTLWDSATKTIIAQYEATGFATNT